MNGEVVSDQEEVSNQGTVRLPWELRAPGPRRLASLERTQEAPPSRTSSSFGSSPSDAPQRFLGRNLRLGCVRGGGLGGGCFLCLSDLDTGPLDWDSDDEGPI